MSDTQAPAVTSDALFDILVAFAGTSESFREDFARCMAEGCREYRIGGPLGFGGKYWPETNRVTCYPEDETPQRKEIIERTNYALKIHGGLMSNGGLDQHPEHRKGTNMQTPWPKLRLSTSQEYQLSLYACSLLSEHQPSDIGGTKGTMKKETCDLPPVDCTASLGNKCGHQCRTLAGLHTCTLPKGHRFCHQEFRQLSAPNASWGDNDGQYPDSPNN